MSRKPTQLSVVPEENLSGREARDLAVGAACRVLTGEEADHIAEIWLQKVGGSHIEDAENLDSCLERLNFWLEVKRRLQEAKRNATPRQSRGRQSPSPSRSWPAGGSV